MSIGLLLASLFTLVELNCENLFDCQHDSLKNDYDFLPTSEKQWTPTRYWAKLNNIGREIISCGEQNRLPDIVCLTEVENDTVMRDLSKRSIIRNAGYEYVITNSNDERGIDVALLYQPTSFHIYNIESLTVNHEDDERPTRDILHVSGELRSGDTIEVFVVHFPSRRDGERKTRPYRLRAANTILNRISTMPLSHSIIVTGDFNDYKDDASLKEFYSHGFINTTRDAKGTNGAEGTYKFQGQWGSLDHILIRGKIIEKLKHTFINDQPFLLQGEGEKLMPRRTYRGNFYQKGYSDHLPLIATFEF
ncbi:MAG: endonuclease/exonuclease/phosphatase family protein [Prevotellaceae bacterium]|nr:endonuclease/exonuclease/phosphatase family protein [Prevotellaceae bacterium]